MEGLGKQGLKEGEIFKQSTLERVDLELSRQYVAQGRYGASIDTNVEELPRNRVAIHIDIKEGKTSTIQHINVVGNHAFTEQDLLDVFELKTPSFFSFIKNDDKYSKEKLKGDLEKLESYYKDRGYVTFNVDSTQVSITPDKRHVYLTVNVTEGGVYKIDKVELVGELHDVSPDALRSLLLVQPGQMFSGALVTASEERLTQALGNSGYTFASASGVPQVHDNGTVDVRFMVEAGKRAYVRRIEFKGNSVTQDEVLRREMRQMEGGWASTALIELSKTRLERLGYFKDVNVETPEVAGTDDQVDVKFSVEEQPSGSISATLGYAQSSGLIVGAGYQETNVLGTGNSMSLNVSWSQYQRAVAFNYFNPYFTLDGISRGYNMFYRVTDYNQQNIATYSTDAYGAGVNFSFPIGETQRIGFGLTIEHTKLKAGYYAAQEITQFIDEEGDTYLNYKSNLELDEFDAEQRAVSDARPFADDFSRAVDAVQRSDVLQGRLQGPGVLPAGRKLRAAAARRSRLRRQLRQRKYVRPAVLRELLCRRLRLGARLQAEHARTACDAVAVRPVYLQGPTDRRKYAASKAAPKSFSRCRSSRTAIRSARAVRRAATCSKQNCPSVMRSMRSTWTSTCCVIPQVSASRGSPAWVRLLSPSPRRLIRNSGIRRRFSSSS